MIEAQKAATEGAHVAVPEGLVPAMIMVTVVAKACRNPPHHGVALNALYTFTL